MRKLFALIPLLLAACSASMPLPPTPAPAPDGGTCNAAGLDAFVGQPATAELGQKMLRTSGARVFRWLVPGQIVTMEYSGDRLSVVLDASNRVESARCG